MRYLLSLALLICATLPAKAEIALGEFKTIETRFGTIGVVWRPEGQEFVVWNGQPVEGLETAEITIAGGYAMEGEPFDWVLFNTRHSGNMCPYGYALAKVSAGGVQRTQVFGECLGKVSDLRVLPGKIEIELGDSDVRYASQIFAYSGDSFTQTAVPAVAATPNTLETGEQVARLAGKALYELLNDPTEVARFATIMTPKLVEDLRMATSLPEGSALQGDWLIGTGCQRHLCNAVGGLWAIRVSDGAPFAAFVYRDSPLSTHGDAAALNDPVLSRALGALQIRMSR